MYNNGYDPYGYGYQPSYGYGQQAPYGYGYTNLGNPLLGLIGSLLSGPFGGNWGFDVLPLGSTGYNDPRYAQYITQESLGRRGQMPFRNNRSTLEDMQRRLDRGEGISSDEVELYSKLKNRFQDQKDSKENKLLRKDNRLENRNRKAINKFVDPDNFDYYFTEDQVPDEEWDPNVNESANDKYEDFLQYTKDNNLKLNKKNFEDVWGNWYQNSTKAFGGRMQSGGLKKKVNPGFKYIPKAQGGLWTTDLIDPKDGLWTTDLIDPLVNPWETSQQDLTMAEDIAKHQPRTFITDPNQNTPSLDANGAVKKPLYTKDGKRQGLLLRQRMPRANDVLNTINLATATLNERNNKLRERQLRTRLDDPRNLFDEASNKERGAWYPGPGLDYGTLNPYQLDLSGPARGYFKNGGKMAIGGPIAKDYLYLTNSMIDALSNLGGQVGYID
jgi:hypothetical protein